MNQVLDLGSTTASTSSRAASNLLHHLEESFSLCGKITNLSVGMKTEHLRYLNGESSLNVVAILLPVEFHGIR